MRSLFVLLIVLAGQAGLARAERLNESIWLGASAGARVGSLQEQVGGTSLKVAFRELPAVQVTAEKAIRLFGKNALLSAQAGASEAKFSEVSAVNLTAGKLLLYDFNGELRTSLKDQMRPSSFVGPIFLLGARYVAEPVLWRPANTAGLFSYSRVPTLYGNLGFGLACFFPPSTLRVYLRAGLPLYMAGGVSSGKGVSASVTPEYLYSTGKHSNVSLAVPVAYSNLRFQHLDSFANQILEHEVTETTIALMASYSYRF